MGGGNKEQRLHCFDPACAYSMALPMLCKQVHGAFCVCCRWDNVVCSPGRGWVLIDLETVWKAGEVRRAPCIIVY